jgi:pimeloyl-ACP methyl ester carboxylesterase
MPRRANAHGTEDTMKNADRAADDEPVDQPGWGLLLLEGRSLLELMAMLAAYPFLRQAPHGDGHPVLVLPAFVTSDFATRMLRGFLRDRGYAAHGWKLGLNRGPTPETVAHLVRRLHELHERYARRVSLIGWSLGGVYARELARAFPAEVRQVITLATPFRNLEAVNVPGFVLARRRAHPDEAAFRARLRLPLSVPTTAIYSRTDGIVAWRSCIAEPGPQSESLEVASSHLGIPHHPAVLLTIADRLAQPEGAWKPFHPPAGWRWPFVPRVTGTASL